MKPEGSDASGVGEERKLSLSSLRAPRQVRRPCSDFVIRMNWAVRSLTRHAYRIQPQGNRAGGRADEPWAAEAKEYLRNRWVHVFTYRMSVPSTPTT